MTAPLRAHEIQVNGVRSPVLEGGRSDSPEAVVFVHGNPGSSRDWQSLAAAVAAFARAVALDMPGFGALGAPRFRRTLGARLGGAASDEFASATLINTGVLLGYRWHVLARIWRTPVLGELFQATATRATFRLVFFGGCGSMWSAPRLSDHGKCDNATGRPRRRQRDALLLMSSPLVPASYLTPQCRCGISRFQLAAPAATKANPAKAGGTKPRVLASSATPA